MNFIKGIFSPKKYFQHILELSVKETNSKFNKLTIVSSVLILLTGASTLIIPEELTKVTHINSFLSTVAPTFLLILGFPVAIILAVRAISALNRKVKKSQDYHLFGNTSPFKSLTIMNIAASGYAVLNIFLLTIPVQIAYTYLPQNSIYLLLIGFTAVVASYSLILFYYPYLMISTCYQEIRQETNERHPISLGFFSIIALITTNFIMLLAMSVVHIIISLF